MITEFTELPSANKDVDIIPTSSLQPYQVWKAMKASCDNKKQKSFALVGAKGITYEANFKTFSGFWTEMRYGWCQGAVLKRRDTSKHFTVNNCYWQPPNNKQPYTKADCDSGVWGLCRITDARGLTSWRVRLTNQEGKRVSRMWSVPRYGDVLAFMLAVQYLRDFKEQTVKNS